MYTLFNEAVKVERVNNDVNGNPRYVIHYLNVKRELIKHLDHITFDNDYMVCLQAVGKGFKKYHNKSYGGGIVFQSYNVQRDLEYLEQNVLSYITKQKKVN